VNAKKCCLIVGLGVIILLGVAFFTKQPNWVVAFATILLAIVAIWGPRIQSLFWGPRFAVDAEFFPHATTVRSKRFGCRDNQLVVERQEADAKFIACRIWNTGDLGADKVEAVLTRLVPNPKKLMTPFNLSWTHQRDPQILPQLPARSARLLTIGHITDPRACDEEGKQIDPSDPPLFCLELFVKPNSRDHLLPSDSYKIEIEVAAASAPKRSFLFRLDPWSTWAETTGLAMQHGRGNVIYTESESHFRRIIRRFCDWLQR